MKFPISFFYLFPKTPIEDQMAGQDMLYSSGTTGRPKAVKMTYEPLPYGEVTDAAKMVIALYGFDEKTVYLSPAPLYHAAPLRFSLMALYAGGTVIVMERFDALESLVETRVRTAIRVRPNSHFPVDGPLPGGNDGSQGSPGGHEYRAGPGAGARLL